MEEETRGRAGIYIRCYLYIRLHLNPTLVNSTASYHYYHLMHERAHAGIPFLVSTHTRKWLFYTLLLSFSLVCVFAFYSFCDFESRKAQNKVKKRKKKTLPPLSRRYIGFPIPLQPSPVQPSLLFQTFHPFRPFHECIERIVLLNTMENWSTHTYLPSQISYFLSPF